MGLMSNPVGSRCTLFVTHAWAEGVFEFKKALLDAWPKKQCLTCPSGHPLDKAMPVTPDSCCSNCRCKLAGGAQRWCQECGFQGCANCCQSRDCFMPAAAYICFLSNPQNLNISSL